MFQNIIFGNPFVRFPGCVCLYHFQNGSERLRGFTILTMPLRLQTLRKFRWKEISRQIVG